VLEGSVRRAGSRLRITAQLVEGTTGAHLWAHKFDGAVEDIFDVQDKITESVVALVEPQIQQAEINRSRRERPESLAAYDLYLRALQKLNNGRPEDNAAALDLLDRATTLEPGYAIALSLAAYGYEHRVTEGWPAHSADDAKKSLELAHAALSVAEGDAIILARCGMVLLLIGREYDRGLLTIKRAVEANPNNLMVLSIAGFGHIIGGGSLEDALTFFHRAIRLSPADAFVAMTGLGNAQMFLGHYEEALDWAQRALAINPNWNPPYHTLIAANGHLGRLEQAKRVLAALQALEPGFSLEQFLNSIHSKDPRRADIFKEGLRLAGEPES
jgi:tetratricopeptide (TPR) repeat protein